MKKLLITFGKVLGLFILAVFFVTLVVKEIVPNNGQNDIAKLEQANKVQDEMICKYADQWCNPNEGLSLYNWACGARYRCANGVPLEQFDLEKVMGILHAETFFEENIELISQLEGISTKDNPI